MLDPSIGLQFQFPKFMTAGDILSLKDLQTRSQLNQVNLQEAQRQNQNQISLRDLFSRPGMIDESGLPTPQGVSGVYGIDPMTGMKMQQQMQTGNLQRLQMQGQGIQQQLQGAQLKAERDKAISSVKDNALAAHALVKQRNGSDEEALKAYNDAWLNRVDELDANGTWTQLGTQPEGINHLKTNILPPEQARSGVMNLQQVNAQTERQIADRRAMMTPIMKLQEDRSALESQGKKGTREWKDIQTQIDRLNAPTTMQMYAQNPLTDATARLLAEQRVAGDTSATVGLARNPVALAKVNEQIAAIAKERGLTGKDLAAFNAEFQGTKAGERTLGVRGANIEMAVSEAQNVMPIAREASAKVDRTKYPTLNALLLAAQKGTGDENVVRLATATNALINIYSRAIAPSGVPTISDKDHARDIIANAYSQGQYEAVLNIMEQEMAAARKSPVQVRGAMHEQITGQPLEAPPAPSMPIPTGGNFPAPNDREKGKVYTTPRGPLKWTGTGWVPP